ncbi:hypothetical protein J6590_083629, partial [Homalodisca vitripennis]
SSINVPPISEVLTSFISHGHGYLLFVVYLFTARFDWRGWYIDRLIFFKGGMTMPKIIHHGSRQGVAPNLNLTHPEYPFTRKQRIGPFRTKCNFSVSYPEGKKNGKVARKMQLDGLFPPSSLLLEKLRFLHPRLSTKQKSDMLEMFDNSSQKEFVLQINKDVNPCVIEVLLSTKRNVCGSTSTVREVTFLHALFITSVPQ